MRGSTSGSVRARRRPPNRIRRRGAGEPSGMSRSGVLGCGFDLKPLVTIAARAEKNERFPSVSSGLGRKTHLDYRALLPIGLRQSIPISSNDCLITASHPKGRRVSRPSPIQLVRLMAGALLTLAAGGLISPASARAGCSHPAHLQDAGVRDSIHFEFLSRLGALSQSSERDRWPAHRCDGPSCSRSPESPQAPAAPSAPKLVRAENWGLPIISPPESRPSSRSLAFDQDRSTPSDRVSDLFRPPRLAHS
jgi:hypothetical protein